jgi:hypothetical protein
VFCEYGLFESVRPGGQGNGNRQNKHWQYHRQTLGR